MMSRFRTDAHPTLEIDEVMQTLDRLNSELHDLLVRGLRVCGPEHLRSLQAIRVELQAVGAAHLSALLSRLISDIEADDPKAAAALLETQASLRVFERVLSLCAADFALQGLLPDDLTEDGE